MRSKLRSTSIPRTLRPAATVPSHAFIAALLTAGAIAGCAADAGINPPATELSRSIPLPPKKMLASPEAPSCGEQAAAAAAAPRSSPATDSASTVDATLAMRVRLEFERDCYKAAEESLRRRFAKLQASVRTTARAVERLEQRAID